MYCVLFLAGQGLTIRNVLIGFEKEMIDWVEVYAGDRVEIKWKMKFLWKNRTLYGAYRIQH